MIIFFDDGGSARDYLCFYSGFQLWRGELKIIQVGA